MRHTISNSDDTIDSRDVIKQIRELESEREDLEIAVDNAEEELRTQTAGLGDSELEALEEALADAKEALNEWDNGDDGEELKALKALQDQAEGYASDWQYGAQLIRDSYFEDYAREQAEELTDYSKLDTSWPFDCIDWEKAAEALQMDYTSVEYGDVTYWIR